MIRLSALLKRSLIFVHRWLGVALSVLFLLWFVSGIVMMYWTFPAVTAQDRLERAPVLDPGRVRLSPEEAYAALDRDQPPRQVRLTSFDGRPVYRFGGGERGGRGGGAMVYADTGAVQQLVDDAMLDRVASAWAGRPSSEARKEIVDEIDQWTVGGLRSQLPLTKYSFPDGQQVYVNPDSAEVVQYTTTASRFWAYLGAIPHWLYFTPLRKHQAEWFSVVVWTSLVGTVAAIIGLTVAVWMLSPAKRYRYAGVPTSIPYRGWKRWHTIAGLLFGIVTTTWAFSGLLSMGPFPITNRLVELTVPSERESGSQGAARGRGRAGVPDLSGVLRGDQQFELSAYSGKSPAGAIASMPGFAAKELELTSFAGEPFYLATNAEGDTHVVPVRGEPRPAFATEDVIRVIRDAAGDGLAELRVMDEYDAYYLDRRGERPLPVVYARVADAVGTRYYIDPATARIVGSYDATNWVSRWLYRGLHSLDFPWLYKYRPLWDIVVITLMLGGTALCMTSIVLTWRVIARKLAVISRARPAPSENLALEAER